LEAQTRRLRNFSASSEVLPIYGDEEEIENTRNSTRRFSEKPPVTSTGTMTK